METLRREKDIYIQQIKDTYFATINLRQNSPITVINEVGLDILNFCKTPKNITRIRKRFNTLLEKKLDSTLQKLLKAKLLRKQNSPHKFKKPKVLGAWLHITNECNLRCKYCYLRKTNEHMNWETAKDTIDCLFHTAQKEGFTKIHIKLSGGESTLRPQFIQSLIRYVNEKINKEKIQADVIILSNGIIFPQMLIPFAKQKNVRLMISLDGLEKYNDLQRIFPNGEGTFVHINKTLKNLCSNEIYPFISITITDENLKGLSEVTEYLLKKNLKFGFNLQRDKIGFLNQSQNNFEAKIQPLIKALKEAYLVIEKNLPQWSLVGTLLDRVHFNEIHEYTCAVGNNYLVVNPKGQIAKCQMTIDKPITNIYVHNPLKDIRNDKTGIQNISVDEKSECKTCKWKYWCAGGCPIVTYNAYGRYDTKSPYCEIYKALLPEVIRLEGLRLLKYYG